MCPYKSVLTLPHYLRLPDNSQMHKITTPKQVQIAQKRLWQKELKVAPRSQ